MAGDQGDPSPTLPRKTWGCPPRTIAVPWSLPGSAGPGPSIQPEPPPREPPRLETAPPMLHLELLEHPLEPPKYRPPDQTVVCKRRMTLYGPHLLADDLQHDRLEAVDRLTRYRIGCDLTLVGNQPHDLRQVHQCLPLVVHLDAHAPVRMLFDLRNGEGGVVIQ